MNENMPFELTNEQRRHLGLTPVEKSWELVRVADKFLYFDGDIIRKVIESSTVNKHGNALDISRIKNFNEYYEADLCEHTAENRTILLPKTKRGKPKKLNHTATLSFSPFGVYFHFYGEKVSIANYTTQTTFYHCDKVKDGSLKDWLDEWVSEATDEDMRELKLFKKAKRQHVKYREGDFFTFKIGRRKWGFGRIVMNISEVRNKPDFTAKGNYGLRHLMGKPLCIMIYKTMSDTPEISIDDLCKCRTLPCQYIMDNRFYYGEYRIIGNKPVTPEEWEPIISYDSDKTSNNRRITYLQYGLICRETPIEKFDKYLPRNSTGKYESYAMGCIGFGITKYSEIENLINDVPVRETAIDKYDLRNEQNRDIKREIFHHFGLDPDKTYAENLKLSSPAKGLFSFFRNLRKPR